jgi:PAS domain-containing protein
MYVDITPHRSGDESLRERDALLRTIVTGTSDAVFVKDRLGRYLVINAAGARAPGRDADTIVGRDDIDCFRSETAKVLMDHDRRVMSQGTAHTFEEVLRAPRGTTIRPRARRPSVTPRERSPASSAESREGRDPLEGR